MDKSEKPKYLPDELEKKRRDFYRYYHSYIRAYHEIKWELEEIRLLLLTHEHSDYNTWKLNEVLYRYAESSINTLFWIFGNDNTNFPFVHWFLRQWRNENHHKTKIDFQLYDIGFHINGEQLTYTDDYYIVSVLSTERIKNKVEEYFGTAHLATNATVAGLIKNHHTYMLDVFSGVESNMKKDMPNQFLVSTNINKRLLTGGTYKTFISDDEFWKK
jgi:hypothetical protein